LFICEMNLKSGKLEYINAGHFPPFLKHNGQVTRLDQGCTVIGAFESITDVDMGEVRLNGEGLLLTYTDGLIDIRNEMGDHFDETHIEKAIRTYTGHSACEFNKVLQEDIEQFKGEMAYPDDIAVLTCWFSSGKAAGKK